MNLSGRAYDGSTDLLGKLHVDPLPDDEQLDGTLRLLAGLIRATVHQLGSESTRESALEWLFGPSRQEQSLRWWCDLCGLDWRRVRGGIEQQLRRQRRSAA